MLNLRRELTSRGVLEQRNWILLGNGPSIVDLKNFNSKIIVGFNRVDKFLEQKKLEIDIYICVSDNVINEKWGYSWTESMLAAVRRSKVAILSHQQIEAVSLWGLDTNLPMEKIILVDEVIIEPRLFKNSAYPFQRNYRADSGFLLSKSGTSVNVGYCLAATMRAKSIELYGCDLGWKQSSGNLGDDRNHYFSDYRARIKAPWLENLRMDFVHLKFSREMSDFCRIINHSTTSSIEYFDRPNQQKQAKNPSYQRYLLRRGILYFDESIRSLKRFILKGLRLIRV